MIQTTLWVLKENNPAIVISFLCVSRWQDAPISALYIVVDSFISGACRVTSQGLQEKKFQFATNFPW